jgi:hypothetical protein
MTRTWLVIAAASAALWAQSAYSAETAPQIWLNAGIYSYHFERDRYRDENYGFGAEILLNREHGFLAGTYINSERARSHYIGYEWRPLQWNPGGLSVSAGLVITALDGYPNVRNGNWFVAPLPVLAIEGKRFGINFSVIPSIGDRLHGAFAIQPKLKIW